MNHWLIEAEPDFQGPVTKRRRKFLQTGRMQLPRSTTLLHVGILKCLKDHNVRVPDDILSCRLRRPCVFFHAGNPLTTVRQPIADIAQKTVEVLYRQINGPGTEEKDYYIDPTKVRL